MSRPRNEKTEAIISAVLRCLAAALVASGASLCLCGGLIDKRGGALPVLIACFVTAMLCALYLRFVVPRFRFRARLIAWLMALGALAAWGVSGGGPIHDVIQIVRAAALALTSDANVLSVYALKTEIYVSVLIALLMSYFSADGEFAPAATLFLLIAVPVCPAFDRDMALRLMPGVMGLLLLLSARGGRIAAAALAALLAVAGFFLMPKENVTAEPLRSAASDIKEFVEDYLMYDDVRTAYSLAADGYLPLDTRLGGAAAPSERAVMEVTTDRAVRLRATAQDTYTGAMWYDTLSSRRYLYVSPNFFALRDALFDLSLPAAYAGAPETTTVKIHMLADATTTLFVPQRLRGIEVNGERMVLYYNTASELFLTRELTTGDEYAVEYLPLRAGDAATERLIAAGESANDPHYAEVAAQYLGIPEHMQSEVHAIAARAAEGAQTAYQKARSIESYLSSHYQYNLQIDAPPENVDFVTWFLLGEEKAGYCTYFASAMTILCRMAGLPARYVTGYLVSQSESGVTLVAGKNAHAWTEVYLNGFGWLAFDATPEGRENGQNPPSDTPSNPPAAPSPSPSPTPTPTPESAPSPSPSPSPEGGSDAPTPTPSPEGAPPENDADPPAPQGDPPRFPWLWLLLPLVIALLIIRYLLTEPCRRAARRPSDAAVIYYGAVADALAAKKTVRRADETLLDFACRAEASGAPEGFSALAAAVSSLVYGRAARFTAAQAEEFKSLYIACRGRLNPFVRAALAVRRALSFKKLQIR